MNELNGWDLTAAIVCITIFLLNGCYLIRSMIENFLPSMVLHSLVMAAMVMAFLDLLIGAPG